MPKLHRTRIIRSDDASRRAVQANTSDGILSHTRIELSPAERGYFNIVIDQIEKLPRHKRGISRSLTFTISRAGLEWLAGVEAV